jgi:hypothetical protein
MSDVLTDAERDAFRAAASAALGSQERVEARMQHGMADRANQQALAREVQKPLQSLLATVAEIHRNHPNLPAIRFRGRIFAFNSINGQIQMAMFKEQEIETVEG